MADSDKKLTEEGEEKEVDLDEKVESEDEVKETQDEDETDSPASKDSEAGQEDDDLEEVEAEEEKEPEGFHETVVESEALEDEKDDQIKEEAGQSYSNEVKFHGFNPNDDNKSDIFYEPPRGKKSMKKFIIWLTILSVLALVAGFFATMAFKENVKEEAKKVEASSTPVPTPTPEPKPELDRAQWSLEVLNGSGISGQAKKVADAIKELGYVVTKSGNADKQTYEESQIFVTEDLKEKVNLLITDLKDVIRIATIAGILKESTPSARIIIGKDIQ